MTDPCCSNPKRGVTHGCGIVYDPDFYEGSVCPENHQLAGQTMWNACVSCQKPWKDEVPKPNPFTGLSHRGAAKALLWKLQGEADEKKAVAEATEAVIEKRADALKDLAESDKEDHSCDEAEAGSTCPKTGDIHHVEE